MSKYEQDLVKFEKGDTWEHVSFLTLLTGNVVRCNAIYLKKTERASRYDEIYEDNDNLTENHVESSQYSN